jgi:hypothetical protein
MMAGADRRVNATAALRGVVAQRLARYRAPRLERMQ